MELQENRHKKIKAYRKSVQKEPTAKRCLLKENILYAENSRVQSQGCILGSTLFPLYIYELPDDVIYNIAIYADDTTPYSKCDQASDLWQQLELASEFELQDCG